MKIRWGSNWIADDAFPAFDLRYGGKQVVQEAQLLRALAVEMHARSNRSSSLGFAATHTFTTIREAEEFAVTHYDGLDDAASLLLRVGTPPEGTKDISCAGAVLVSVDFMHLGVSVTVRYSFVFPRPNVPVSSPPSDVLLSDTVAIPAGQEFVDVVGLALASPPQQVLCGVRKPLDGYTFFATVDGSTVTAAGFRAWLNGTTPDGNYNLDFIVIP